jgi:site-specific DNA-methyltransferase (adenine-specific)
MIYANDNDDWLPPNHPDQRRNKYAMLNPNIHLGDCLEVMKAMPSNSVDMVFTSPPYNLSNLSGSGFKSDISSGKWKNAALAKGYGLHRDDMPHDDYTAWQKEVLTECWRLLKDDGAIFYNHKPRVQGGEVVLPTIYNPGLPLRQIVIWDRKSGFNFNQSFYLPSHEWVMIFAKPAFRLRSKAASGAKDIWRIVHERNNSHPAPFPVELPMTAIETTTAQVILDPFCGSGTTGVACARLGRQFIGIELEPKFHQMAIDRIAAEFPIAA